MTIPAREYHTQQVHYFRKAFTYADGGSTITVGTLPEGALICKPLSGVQVNVAFNGDTTNTLDLGPSTNTDLWATDLALGTIGFIPLDEAVSNYVSADTIVQGAVVSTASASAGEGIIVIAYIPNNDG